MKPLRILATLVLLAATALAQVAVEKADYTVSSGTVIQFNDGIGSGMRRFEYIISGGPATASIPLKACMRGGTCTTLETSTATTNSTRQVAGVYDYFTITPTFSGGTAPTLQVNMTAIPRGSDAASSGGALSAQVQGTAGNGAAPIGNPNLIAGIDTGSSVQRDVLVNGQGALVNSIALADTDATPNNPVADTVGNLGPNGPLRVSLHAFDGGTNLPRLRVATLANLPTSQTTTARNSTGAQIIEKGSRWSVNSAPAAGSQATASIAAEASVRHVLDTLCFSSGSAVAPVLTSLQVNVRDGATGAGTVLLSFEVDIPATTGEDTPPVCIGGLGLVGTTNTAMTVEWSASLANLKQTATAIGYNVN